jgi:hypothetical protein
LLEPPCALIADDDENSLGELALRILRLRVDVYYAKGCDEAWLLAQQEAKRIGAVLFPPGIDRAGVKRVAEAVQTGGGEAPTLVVVGSRPGAKACEQLRALEVDLALWEPFDESDLRAVISAAIAPKYAGRERTEPRLPTMLLGRAFAGTRRRDTIVATLSQGGAFLETPAPMTPGTQISLEIALPGGVVMVKADVVYSRFYRDAEEQPSRPVGMGVSFSRVSDTAAAELRRFLKENEKRFRV